MLKSSLCFYGETFIFVKGTIRSVGKGTNEAARQEEERCKELTFKNCAPFTDSISEVNNTKLDFDV